jgi:hypothetical protein
MAYSYYRSVTIDYTKCGTANSTDFPVLVSFTDATFKTVANGGKIQSGAGYDINFYSDIGLTTALYYQVERWISNTGECIFWVKVPTLSATANTVIYVAYGDASITTFQSSVTAVWNSNFQGVWHFPNGTTLNVQDSSLYGRNGINNNGVTATTGKIDGGANFNSSSSQYVTTSANILTGTSITISGWIYPATPATRGFFFDQYDNTLVRGISMEVGLTANKLRVLYAPGIIITSLASLTANTWYHVAFTVTGGNGILYINGVSDNTGTGTATVSSTNVEIGRFRGGPSLYWNGRLDEIKASNVARSSSWILSEYNNQNSPSTFFTLGTETLATSTSDFFQFF